MVHLVYSHHVFVLFSVQSCSLSRGQPTGQSSTSGVHTSDTAVDGYYNEVFDSAPYCAQTVSEATPWWYVDLGGTYEVKEVWITNRDQASRWF